MADLPLGGMGVANADLGRVDLFDTVYGPAVYAPSAADALDPAGLILARNSTNDKLVPYVAAGADGVGTPVAVLGDAVQADSTPNDFNLQAIMTGRVRLARLVVLASGVPGTVTVLVQDQLKDQGIFALDSFDLSKLDNQ